MTFAIRPATFSRVLLFSVALWLQPSLAATFHYTVSMPQPATHYFEVLLQVGENSDPRIRLVMPVWTPGSYLVREYARHVQDFAAVADNQPLSWTKTSKNTWEIETGGAGSLEVTYQVYANDLTVRSADLDDRHGYFNGAALFMYAEGQTHSPFKLTVKPYDDWKIATGLDPVAGEPDTFHASNFDILVDSPVEIGRFEQLEFQVRTVPHHIIIDGPARYDREKMERDVRRVVEKQVELFGEVPYRHYTFILHLGLAGGGGLEHHNSTSIQSASASFRRQQDWESLLETISHEFFHLWNVKRIRPEALGPFDYTQENYTRALWISEGITSYYDRLFLVRAGIVTPKRYLQKLAEDVQSYLRTPGRLKQTVEEASFDAWIKFYRRDENSLNSQISYYDKGALLGTMLDLEIRHRTANARSLDDVMRALNEEYAKKGRGFRDEDFQKVVEQVASSSFQEFFDDHVRGLQELPVEESLALAGLTLAPKKTPEGQEDKEKLDTVYLGIRTRQAGDRTTISNVVEGSPAQRAGLNAGDELLAFDGVRVSESDYRQRLQDYNPGDALKVQVFRDNHMRDFSVRLDPPPPSLEITKVENPSDQQKQIYQSWLQKEWDEAGRDRSE